MTIVDTSVWIDHLRSGNDKLKELLTSDSVFTHPFVVGELACGGLKNRAQILTDLNRLPLAMAANHDDVLRLIDRQRLSGKGIGWVDAHLLAAALISKCSFWTLDKSLARVASALGITA